MDNLQESLEKGNFWKEYKICGRKAYKKHWKEHIAANILGVIYAVIKRAVLHFFGYGLLVFPWFFLFGAYQVGIMEAINNLQSILNQINSPSDLRLFVHIWVYISLLFFIVHLFFNPIRTKAKLERERQEKYFMSAYKGYIPTLKDDLQ